MLAGRHLRGQDCGRAVFNEPGKPRFPDLFQEITKRHTNRKKYEDRAIEDETLQRLKDCVNRDGFRLDILTDKEGKNEMADLLARAHKIQLEIRPFERSWHPG